MENFEQTEPVKPRLQWPFVDKIPEYQIFHKVRLQSYPNRVSPIRKRVIYHLKI
jgi:hypothetical protein